MFGIYVKLIQINSDHCMNNAGFNLYTYFSYTLYLLQWLKKTENNEMKNDCIFYTEKLPPPEPSPSNGQKS